MRTATLSMLILAGCLYGSSLDALKMPDAPAWSPDCEPGAAWMKELAYSDEYVLDEVPGDAAAARDLCLGEISRRGFLTFLKPEEERVATTVPYAVFLGKKFDDEPAEGQAAVACHELVHVKWEQAVGLHAAKIYATTYGRLAVEANAYRESYRVMRAVGVPEAEVEEAARRRAATFGERGGTYRMAGDAARCSEPFMLKAFGLGPGS